MTKIICAEDCGNAPKKLLIRDWLTALAKADNASVLKHLSDDIVWKRVGRTPLRGKAAVAAELQKMKREPKAEMSIENILTHGRAAAANGSMQLKNGKSFGFCHVFQFTSAKADLITSITSYEIRA